jgi:LysM repeat protein
VRENVSQLGDLLEDFDFSQPPRSSVVLPTYPTLGATLPNNLPTSSGRGAADTAYMVQPGDTLSEIAERFGTSAEILGQANGIENLNLIFVGQTVYVPMCLAP